MTRLILLRLLVLLALYVGGTLLAYWLAAPRAVPLSPAEVLLLWGL